MCSSYFTKQVKNLIRLAVTIFPHGQQSSYSSRQLREANTAFSPWAAATPREGSGKLLQLFPHVQKLLQETAQVNVATFSPCEAATPGDSSGKLLQHFPHVQQLLLETQLK
jgi:hypothetical protein